MKIKTKLGKGLSVFIAVLVFAAALAACSTSENNQSTGQSTSVSQDSKTSDKAGGESESTQPSTESVKKGADTENKAQAKQPEELPEVDANYKSADIKVGVLKGPTSLGMLKLMDGAENDALANKYTVILSSNVEEAGPKLLNGEVDIMAAPVNMGAVLANKSGGKVQMLAINTLGVLYIGAKGEDIKSVADLKGKTIYTSGKGGTPEYVLKYILTKNGIDPDKDVTIEWKSEHTEVISTIAGMDKAVVMCPEPFMTVAKNTVEGFDEALDLTKEWDKVSDGNKLITAGLFVRTDFAKEHPEQIKRFLQEYKYSTQWVNANIAEAAKLAQKYDIVKEPVALKAIPKCNITYIDGKEMAELTKAYLEILYSYNPQSVGTEVPGDAFFFIP
ncbi:hypothetical protein HMPREF9333_01214 [Johnsonella ignava ATCC 51276]|uniref:SsuA/THI5-like domain-containing protein n=1 Tax=Johnsonella ignava ATCC 51276 TaxID=679200 RepID=G5GI24_9FIRM|nr:ABC transporter substrate-binding protein [Johnsonella ignava]EHI55499.1 hypothetical protein HMPREF9333_01214 [Johnsonella ignava ATCC 51276]